MSEPNLELMAELATTRDSYWIRVPAKVASWLDSQGLIMEQHTSRGNIEANRNFRAGRSLLAALASPNLGIAAQSEVSAVPVDAPAVRVPLVLEGLIERIIDGIDARLQNLDAGRTINIKNDSVFGMNVDAQRDFLVDSKPVADATGDGVDAGLFREESSVPVDHEPGHNSSPSVGAPSGAVCDNPNPTDGELNPGAASSPNGAAPAPTQTTAQE